MSFMRASSPHTHVATDTTTIMQWVILATLPGFFMLSYFFGWGTLINVLLASATTLACEAVMLHLRQRPIAAALKDHSALVTAVLLGLALPPYAPYWLTLIGAATAIIIAKQLYGGLGYNPFNPAMVGYVILLISFPLEMTRWAIPQPLLTEGAALPALMDALRAVFLGDGGGIDGFTGATPLDIYKTQSGLLSEQIYAENRLFSMASFAGVGWEWVNLAFLCGGLWLLYKKVFTWHAPVGMLAALSAMALLFYDQGSSESGGPLWLHLFCGGTMLGAFFIITDPVSSAVSNSGRLIYGAAIGVLVYVIRVWGNYPDAIAFAVLLMNFAAPFIDYYTLPRAYGHTKAERATRSRDP